MGNIQSASLVNDTNVYGNVMNPSCSITSNSIGDNIWSNAYLTSLENCCSRLRTTGIASYSFNVIDDVITNTVGIEEEEDEDVDNHSDAEDDDYSSDVDDIDRDRRSASHVPTIGSESTINEIVVPSASIESNSTSCLSPAQSLVPSVGVEEFSIPSHYFLPDFMINTV